MKRAYRKAFTLIEVVLSLVVVGLVILSIPLIVRQSNANTMQSQNVIGYFNAMTLMDTIRTKPWDTANIADYTKSGEYYILNTGNKATDCYSCDPANTAFYSQTKCAINGDGMISIFTKKGLANYDRRRMCDPSQKTASAIQNDANYSAINHFDGYTMTIQNKGNNYFRLTSNVNYADINFANGTINTSNNPTDIKRITITLERIDPNGGSEKAASYEYYATNIGTNIPASKDNQ